MVPSAKVDVSEAPGWGKWISSTEGFLTGPGGSGNGVAGGTLAQVPSNDTNRIVKAFVQEHSQVFGFGAEALDAARVSRDFVSAHNGLRTVAWEQQVDGIAVFEGVFIAHTTARGELVSISSQFVGQPDQAADAGTPNRAVAQRSPGVSAAEAVALAANDIGEEVDVADVSASSPASSEPDQRQTFTAPLLNGDSDAHLVWLPMSESSLRLCWDVIVTSRARGEMFRSVVDAETGDVLVRHCLTDYLTPASYRVYTSESPSPMSPGYPTPVSTQPPLVSRSLVTLSALDTNASPNGWINDGGNETLGNNVDAHTDRNADNLPDLPRPQGTSRVFDFPLDLGQDPTTYTNAAVVQLFYWNNFMHDRLYQLGFTEAAGNFQTTNFGRGGLGNDAVQADAQDGSGTDNANFSTPPDGSAGRMQMYVFVGPTPDRDGDLDAEVVLHEYTHGLSNRRVGQGVGISALQPQGMGEGWSDFYGLSLLSEAGDDVNGVYAAGGYASYLLGGSYNQNYYFGIRRYPYCTDMTKNPLTFKDLDPAQASTHSGIPRNPVIGTTANEVHNMGELWCVTLWEARANLITKYGWTNGNQLMLQLVTDGMNLSPANPTFLQARDAIIQADLVDNGGANRNDLWTAFAKRGMGFGATSPANSTTTGVHESFDVPDDLSVTPGTGWASSGQIGGPFTPSCQAYVVRNTGSNALNWTATPSQSWVTVTPSSGSLSPGTSNTLNVCLTSAVNTFTAGTYSATVNFSNLVTSVRSQRDVALNVSPPRVYFFSLDSDPGWSRQGEWAFGKPAGLGGTSYGYHDPSNGATSTNVFGINLNGDYSISIGGPYYLTAGPLNFSGYAGVRLQFQRWLNSDYPPYVYETVELSTNGSTWIGLWTNGPGAVADTAWTKTSFDISQYADNRPAVYVRWGHRVGSSGAFAYSGWNIDDIEFLGAPPANLALNLPTNATEGVGTVSATVTASPAPTNNLVLTLSSSDTTEVTVPANVTLNGGQSNVTFNLTIIDDGELDGPQTATITATAPGYAGAVGAITVLDNETATLNVAAPAAVTEGDGLVACTVSVSAPPAANVQVSLTSSDVTALQVPAGITIPAGQTSAVVYASVIDDAKIDGDQSATITAHVANWTDGTGVVVVHDNESTNLTVFLPVSAREGDGVLLNGGSVHISGTLATNLLVNLGSSDLTELTVPAGVTIPAGQTAAAFNLTVVDDTEIDGAQTVSVSASSTGFVSGSSMMTVYDNESPPVPFNPSPADLATNVVQSNSLSWQSGAVAGEVITNDVYFGTTPTPGASQLLGTTTNTIWPLPLLAPQTTYYWQIVARKAGVTPGPVWRFTTRGVDHFQLSAVSSPQAVSTPFNLQVTARDSYNTVVSNFTGPATLTASAGTNGIPVFSENFESGTLSGWTIGTGTYTRTVTSQTAAGGNYSLTLIGGNSNHGDGVSHTLSNLTPGQITFYVRASATNTAGGYFVIGTGTLNTSVISFFYMRTDGTMGINEDISGWHGVPYVANRWYKITLVLDWANRRENYLVDDVLAYSNIPFRSSTVTSLTTVFLYNFSSTQAWWDEITFSGGNLAAPLTISPATTGSFTNGLWNGSVAVLQPATNVVLQADDGHGHVGSSNPFDVQLQNDLSVTGSDSPHPVALGANVTYTVTVTNIGPLSATGVLVTNVLSSGGSIASVTASQGTWSVNGNTVSFNLGTLPGPTNATLTVTALANQAGALSNTATVYRAETDPFLANNLVTISTPVTLPAVSINDVSVVEGNSGTTNATFTVSVSPAPPQLTSVYFSTSDSSAVAPGDYQATNGWLTFAPGETNKSLTVAVKGDTLNEANETFYVYLSGLTNATLARSPGVGTILNDDPVPSLSIGDVTLLEGNNRNTNAVFPVTLSSPSSFTVSATFTTVNGNATNGSDYLGVSGTITFSPGITNGTISVTVIGDTTVEPDENFYVDLSGPANATLAKREGACTILNDDGLPGMVDHFAWSPISSPQYVGEPFGTTLTALDAFNTPVTGFNGTAILTGLDNGGPPTNNLLGNPPYYSSSYSYYTAGYSFTPTNNLTVTHVRSYSGTKVSIWTEAGTLLASQNLSGTSGVWTETALGTPLQLNAGSTYRVGVYAGSYYLYYWYPTTNNFPDGTILVNYYAYGDVFPTSTISPRFFVDLRYSSGASVPITPAVTGTFTNGVWSGPVTTMAPATNLFLRADDGNGHNGMSSPAVAVQLHNDISVCVSDSPRPVCQGGQLTYSAVVTNTGPSTANGVVVTNWLPSGSTFVSAISSQGSCTYNNGIVTCQLGQLAPATNALITLIITAGQGSSLSNRTSVYRTEADPYLTNNTATTVTPVVPLPSVTVNDASVREGNSGTTNLNFNLLLWPPPVQTATVYFSTANGTATAPGDYIATNGQATFGPGQTNVTVPIVVYGNNIYSGNKTFYLNLTGSSLATIARSQALGTITNDDPMPALSISDVSLLEGNLGTTNMVFNVTLSTPSALTTTFYVSTIAGTATSGSDFLATNGYVTMPPLATNANIVVTVLGDMAVEPDEIFYVDLSTPANAVLAKREGVGTIVNDDGLPGQADHFVWSPCGPTQYAGEPFPATITALDAFNNTAVNFNSSVGITGSIGGPSVTSNILGNIQYYSYSSGTYTLGYQFTPSTNLVVTHVRSYSGTKVSIWTDTGVLLATQTVSGTAGVWTETPLTTPLSLSAGSHYRIGLYTGGGYYYYGNGAATNFPYGTIDQGYYALTDAFPTSLDSTRWYFVDLRYNVGSQVGVSVSPTFSGSFTNGIWAGNISVQSPATNLVLTANDGNGHTGPSSSFNVQTGTDLALLCASWPGKVYVGENLTYTLMVTNRAHTGATGVFVTNDVPDGFSMVSVSSTKGTYSRIGNRYLFSLGSLGSAASAQINMVATPTQAGVLTNSARVSLNETDFNPTNNSLGLQTTAILDSALTGTRSNRFLILTWRGPWILESSPALFGPYLDVPGASSPYLVDTTAASQQFFKLGFVSLGPDVSLTGSASPASVYVGENITYSLILSNHAHANATGVFVTNDLPAGVSLVSASTTQGSYSAVGSRLTFSLGTIVTGSNAVLSLVATPNQSGSFTNSALVASDSDANMSNNSASLVATAIYNQSLGYSWNKGSLVLNWTGPCILQTATNAAGPYIDMGAVTNPYVIDITAAPQRFFRLKPPVLP
jgi:uncharacterized repeat protein (TIGR01451 family)